MSAMLPFRDQVALKLIARDGIIDRAWCIEQAQRFADECCVSWGHDWQRFVPTEIGVATLGVADYGRMPSHSLCARCGKHETKTSSSVVTSDRDR